MTDAADRPSSSGHSAYTLAVIMVAYVLAFIDRQILNLLVEPMKRDLHLSDVQISLLQGLSFAMFLSIGGLPIGRLIDSGRRTRILACGIAVWSVMTSGFGLARSFSLLLVSRVGVGVGEATMTPSAYSLIGDLFGKRRLGLAMSLYATGPYFGSGLALILGGLVIARLPAVLSLPVLGAVQGWQVIFLALGPIGLIVALWMATLREPIRRGVGAAVRPSWPEAGAYFKRHAAAIVGLNLTVSGAAMTLASVSAWAPSFFVRTYHLKTAEVGAALGWRVMVFGAAGALAAGVIGDALRRRNWPCGRLAVLIVAAFCAAPLAAVVMLCASASLSLMLIGPLYTLITLAVASGPAALQEITPNRLRGLQHAVAVMMVNLLSLGLGPTAVALVTDAALRDENKLGLALAVTLPVMALLAAAIGLLTWKPYRDSLSAIEHAAA